MSRILIVGATGGSHIGDSLLRAARKLAIPAELVDVSRAWRHGTIVQKLLWEFAGRRPVALNRFSAELSRRCDEFKPQIVLSTGNAPVRAEVLKDLRRRGIKCLNFSTDDPFKPGQLRWFLRALPEYDTVFTPRQSNMEQFKAHGCRDVVYLPFGYDPELFFLEPGSTEGETDLFFAGTGEPERAEYIESAIEAGMNVGLYGSYWKRFPRCAAVCRGQADIPTLRQAISSCKVALCLVRHENRDGHSMRTFELPAVGACMVVEDTPDHRRIFGSDAERVIYCGDPKEMVAKTQLLLIDAKERARLRDAAHRWIVAGRHTYADRLATMINHGSSPTERRSL